MNFLTRQWVLFRSWLGFPEVLFRGESPISGAVSVIQKGAERGLLVRGICQSVNAVAPRINQRYWGRVVAEVVSRRRRVRSCLLLGLGAGTVAHLLVKAFPEISIVGVEIDPLVVTLGQRFFETGEVPGLRVVTADAAAVVAHPESFGVTADQELVLCDIYCGGHFPEEFAEPSFLAGVRRLLAPGGLAVFNRVGSPGEKLELDGFIEKIAGVFGDLTTAQVLGPGSFSNRLIFASAG